MAVEAFAESAVGCESGFGVDAGVVDCCGDAPLL
jgi:hypothetical protein